MINLRYHVVSLIAVFLALGLGILMGVGVIGRGTIDRLQNRLDSVERTVSRSDKENSRLNGQVQQWEKFAEQGRAQPLSNQLKDVPVIVVGVDGIDRKAVDGLRNEVTTAGGQLEGTLSPTRKVNLSNQSAANALAAGLGVRGDTGEVLRATALAR